MRPITPLQIKVVELSATLPKITDEQIQYGVEKCSGNYAKISRSKLHCLECGHSWKPEKKTELLAACNCPECGKKLQIIRYKGTVKSCSYYGIFTISGGMQVIRIFRINKFGNIGKPCDTECFEVMQHWITQEGERVTMSKLVNGFSINIDDWIRDSELEIRKPSNSYGRTAREDITPTAFWKRRRILPILKRNGFKGNCYLIPPHVFFTSILKDHRCEQLLKAGQIYLLRHRILSFSKEDDYWNTIRICIRHGYIVEDASMYYDYIKMLRRFGKDTLNPHYVCPNDLNKEHDRWVEKKRIADRAKNLEERREQMEIEQAQYEREKKRYFGIELGDEEIQIGVIKHVADFMDEGEILHHCVYRSEYYKNENSLILSARKGGKRLETIEVGLHNLKIIQSRGVGNKDSPYHDRIMELVNKNMGQIEKCRYMLDWIPELKKQSDKSIAS